ncbi:hypothetical protein CANARDRAFT_203638 [[Candida] arabinofermentans NRRL YB-2248]|uniref:U2 small nuclear ribonucleoprotein A' n=1 Tax=[Candida] arabinofermentans NRRL YB-2248 TaxID=983967 RepID=A0A1E4SUM7_9ASCO|nr:hypothetical protein CANARDRAFT_203638 [[Candida] arabinofermentans NRRL YB-2248]
MRLTSSVIIEAPEYINPVQERVLSLRSLQIPIIENLNTTQDIYECIDLTDNEIRIFGISSSSSNNETDFKLLKLKSLLLGKNKISIFDEFISSQIPNLQTLSLIENNINDLVDLEPLFKFKKLLNLYLVDNPIVTVQYYRLWCVFRIPSLKILDFQKVKDHERVKAIELFGSVDDPTDLARSILNGTNTKSCNGDVVESKSEREVKLIIQKLTDSERKNLELQLQNAENLNDIEKIEKILQNGYY